MVQACGANIYKRHDLFPDAVLQRMLIHCGVHTGESLRYFNTQILGKCNTHHAIACIDLMAQAYHFDITVTINRITYAYHRICEIDKPRIRTSLLHIMCDLHDGTNIAGRVREAAGSAVL